MTSVPQLLSLYVSILTSWYYSVRFFFLFSSRKTCKKSGIWQSDSKNKCLTRLVSSRLTGRIGGRNLTPWSLAIKCVVSWQPPPYAPLGGGIYAKSSDTEPHRMRRTYLLLWQVNTTSVACLLVMWGYNSVRSWHKHFLEFLLIKYYTYQIGNNDYDAIRDSTQHGCR